MKKCASILMRYGKEHLNGLNERNVVMNAEKS